MSIYDLRSLQRFFIHDITAWELKLIIPYYLGEMKLNLQHSVLAEEWVLQPTHPRLNSRSLSPKFLLQWSATFFTTLTL